MKPVLISGIQPSGPLHIGNYLSVFPKFTELQNSGKYQCYFFIADLHSLSEDFESREKPRQILELAADCLAAGISPDKTTFFVQSEIPEQTELAWILSAIAPFGELKRMTQFKEKSESQTENINLGLLAYPVLMAADILLYDGQKVLVGADQLQHLELARTLCRKFNRLFGKTFIEPQPILIDASRIMSLDNPLKKMSKSQPAGCLFLDDKPEIIKTKLQKAVTDSGSEIKFNPETKPAISNLLTVYAAFSGKTILEIEKQYQNSNYADFKKDLAELLIKELTPFQKKKNLLRNKKQNIKSILEKGAEKARKQAILKIRKIKEKVGLSIY